MPVLSRDMRCSHVRRLSACRFDREAFTLHGLWVNYDTGKYPQFCTHDAFDADEVCTLPCTASSGLMLLGTWSGCEWRFRVWQL